MQIKTILHQSADVSKPIIIFLKGLPGSGKSTFAKAITNDHLIRLNNDVFRSMMCVPGYVREQEGVVEAGIRAAGMDALRRGISIVLDNVHFSPRHKNFWLAFAQQHDFTMEEIFFDEALDVCIERDSKRPDGERVGATRIKEMYDQHIGCVPLTTIVKYEHQSDCTLPWAVIVDIDGTLAFMNGRGAFEDARVDTDVPNMPIVELVKLLDRGYEIIIVSGRQSTPVCKELTEKWLNDNLGLSHPYTLLMRAADDTRKDAIVKRELFEQHIAGKYSVFLVLDDRDQTVEMWRKELHLPCLQVNYGNF